MDKWTGVRGDGGDGYWLKESEGISQKHIGMTLGHGQWYGNCLREWRQLGGGGKGGKFGITVKV